jgi:hypothetical protein
MHPIAAGAQESFTIDPPEGTELWQQLQVNYEDDKAAALFVFAGGGGELSAVGVTLKNGEERKRKSFELGEVTREAVQHLLLEDLDLDERVEAVFVTENGTGMKILAWEWVGTSIFTDPDSTGWAEVLNKSDGGTMEVLRDQLTEKARLKREGEVINDTIDGLIPQIRTCAEKAVIKHGLSTIKVTIRFVIDAQGAVGNTGLVSSNLNHKPSEKCAAAAVAKLDFEGQVQGPAEVELPLEFDF